MHTRRGGLTAPLVALIAALAVLLVALRFGAMPTLKVAPPAWLIRPRLRAREWQRQWHVGRMVYGVRLQLIAVPAEAVPLER
jgi:hypothetical protein